MFSSNNIQHSTLSRSLPASIPKRTFWCLEPFSRFLGLFRKWWQLGGPEQTKPIFPEVLKKVKQGLIHPISWLCVDTMKFWIQPELSNEYLDRCGEYLEFLDAFNGWWIIKGGSNQSATRPQAPSPPRVWGIASWILEVAERSQKYIFSIQRNKMACFLLLWEKSKPREMKYCFQMRNQASSDFYPCESLSRSVSNFCKRVDPNLCSWPPSPKKFLGLLLGFPKCIPIATLVT